MRLLSLLFLLALCGQVVGQRVVWEKRIGWQDDDKLEDVISIGQGLYIACGTSFSKRDVDPLDEPAVMACCFTEQGDTIWTRSLGFNGRSPRLCLGAGGEIYLGCIYLSVPASGFRLLSLSAFGQIAASTDIHGLDTLLRISRMATLSDGSLLVSGTAFNVAKQSGTRRGQN